MTDKEREAWLDSYSMGFVDRAGRLIKNKDVEKFLADPEYRTVASNKFQIDGEEVHVSTVFLGLPHPKAIFSDGTACYETMIFGGKHDQWQHRWENAAIASKAHAKVVAALKAGDELPYENTDIMKAFLDMLHENNDGEEWKRGTEYEKE